MNAAPYPVIQELRLPAVARKFGSRTRRNLAELPPYPPGTALVFQAGGQFIVYDEHRHLNGTEDFVLGALAVAVVNVRAQKVHADLELPSAHHSEQFAVRAVFQATVMRPEVVVRQGAVDLADALSQHLRRDPRLAEICAAARIEEIADVRVRIDARVRSYYSIRPFEQPGISVALHLVEVLTPKELEERDRRERTAELDSAYNQRLNELEHENKLRLQEQEQERHDQEVELERQHRERHDKLERDFQERNAKRDHEQDKLRAEWEHEQALLKQERDNLLRERALAVEDAEAERAKGFVEAGVPALLALSMAQKLITPLQMAEMQRGDELRAVEQIKDLISTLTNGADADLVSIDVQVLVDNLLEKLTGHRPAEATRPGLSGSEDRAERPSISARTDDDEPDQTPPDENDFLD